MKTAQIYIVLCGLCFLLISLSGCSKDKPQPGCFQEANRTILTTISNATGTIRGPENPFCSEEYVIQPDMEVQRVPLGAFFPCNLSQEFQTDGTRVVFSGYIYESFETEDICADFFEITEIKLFTL